jgi:hypothetical protein
MTPEKAASPSYQTLNEKRQRQAKPIRDIDELGKQCTAFIEWSS